MNWTNVCVEGFCFCETDDNDKAPCGATVPSPFCLSNGICPHFAWSDTTERRVAHYSPLRLVLWDRLVAWLTETAYWKLRWWAWDCLWFNQRKTREFFDSIPIATAENCPRIAEMEEENRKNDKRFTRWFEKVKLEECNGR